MSKLASKEQLEKMLLADRSKKQALAIADWIGDDQGRLDSLVDIMLGQDRSLVQMSSWVAGFFFDREPSRVLPYLNLLTEYLHSPQYDPAVRSIWRSLALVEIPEDYHGILLDQAMNYVQSPKQPAAIRVFSMQVAFHLVLPYPELREELKTILQTHAPHASAGFRSRASKLLAKL